MARKTAPRYRKKPVVVEAILIGEDTIANTGDWPDWLYDAWMANHGEPGTVERVKDPKVDRWALQIWTLEGEMLARQGDYIIRGIEGEIYPCKASIFEASYERVD